EGAIAGLCARPRGLSSERDNHEAALAPTSLAFLLNVSLTLSLEAAGVPVTFSTRSVYSPAVVGLATAAANLVTLLAYASKALLHRLQADAAGIADDDERARPHEAAGGVHDEESREGHPRRAGQRRQQHARADDEATEHDAGEAGREPRRPAQARASEAADP